jgi:hypothetical protein
VEEVLCSLACANIAYRQPVIEQSGHPRIVDRAISDKITFGEKLERILRKLAHGVTLVFESRPFMGPAPGGMVLIRDRLLRLAQ